MMVVYGNLEGSATEWHIKNCNCVNSNLSHLVKKMLHFSICAKFMHETFHFYNQQRRSCISNQKISSSATDEEEEVLPSKCFDVAASSSGGDSFKVCSLNLCKFYSKKMTHRLEHELILSIELLTHHFVYTPPFHTSTMICG